MKSICLLSGDCKASCQAESRASELQGATSCKLQDKLSTSEKGRAGVARSSEQASVAAGAPVPAGIYDYAACASGLGAGIDDSLCQHRRQGVLNKLPVPLFRLWRGHRWQLVRASTSHENTATAARLTIVPIYYLSNEI